MPQLFGANPELNKFLASKFDYGGNFGKDIAPGETGFLDHVRNTRGEGGLKQVQAYQDLYNSGTDDFNNFINAKNETNEVDAIRKAMMDQLGTFAGPGFASSAIPIDFTGDQSSVISSILSGASTEPNAFLDRALARGQLTDVGYGAAKSRLANQTSIAQGKLNEAGTGILDAMRDRLRGVGDRARDAISTATESFDLTPYRNEIDSLKGQLGSEGFKSKLLSQVSPESLFDTGNLISAGGTAQGQTNSQNPFVLQALQDRNKGKSNARGIGSTGSF